MTYSVQNININKTWEVNIQSATISGTHSVDLSTGNIFRFNLSGDVVLNYTNPQKTGYVLLNKCGIYSLTLGTASNWLSNDDEPLTGDNILAGIYDGQDMWVSGKKATTLLLDGYDSAIAYSLRKLKTDYTGNCIRIRRSSDGATKDIGFKNNYLDWEDALDFVGTGAGFVNIWYDQSGNVNNISQATLAEQPRIINSGTAMDLTRFISRDGEIGLLCDDGSARHLRADSGDILKVLRAKSHLQTYTVSSNDSDVTSTILYISTTSANLSRHLVDYNKGLRTGGRRLDVDTFSGTTPGTYTSNLILATSILNHTASRTSIYQNGTLIGTRSPFRGTGVTSDTDSAAVVIGALSNKTQLLAGIISECIVFNTDLESEQSKIENNIVNYYSLT